MVQYEQSFGNMVFSEDVMRSRLPQAAYEALQNARRLGRRLSAADAETVASAMKDWALEKGATHFTHWFQPMTGITAEKHEAFLSLDKNGKALYDFSGKELVQGEADASSFPSGGLRATFEARGYTAWDPTSYAFVKDGTLYIPTAFCSYGGEAIDKKTPLLRSMDALNRASLRILRLFGDTETQAVVANVGAEQEYFLLDQEVFYRRKDLVYTGRTLVGAPAPKGQELEDHYYGAIKPRVAAFMKDLDAALWELGVAAKTEHNEVAPGQHELACQYEQVNISADHNQLVMDLMKRIAARHGLICLLHEKPFAGVNGSGKHNNWSLATDKGENLLNPGDTPSENAQFLLFLCAVIQAVDEYQDLLRITVASASNDHRLGGNEAPPAILSVFLGTELSEILHSIERDETFHPGKRQMFKVGVDVMPRFPKDSTDRNRTSPFAFTGNKFEFRMAGSSQSISETNIALNTAVADVLQRYAGALEQAEDFESALHELIKGTIQLHGRILFDGNGYDASWKEEAARRGLLNLKTTPDCLPLLLAQKNVELFGRNRVFDEVELKARYEIMMEAYVRAVRIEAATLLEMVNKDILPAVSRFAGKLTGTLLGKKAAGIGGVYEAQTLQSLDKLQEETVQLTAALEEMMERSRRSGRTDTQAFLFRDELIPTMERIRERVDALEALCDRDEWPYPSYGDLLFSVR